jgi:cysteine-rich secretory family protein
MPRRKSHRRPAAFLLSLACATALAAAPAPAQAISGSASRLYSLINGDRSSRGLSPLQLDSTLNSIAQAHAELMASQGRIFHNASYPSGAGAWFAFGENVGTSSSVDSVEKAFMASSTHRANILNSNFTHVGVGVAATSSGVMVVEDFLARPGGAQPAPAPARPRAVTQSQPAPPPPPPPPPPAPPPPPPRPRVTGWAPAQTLNDGDAFIRAFADLERSQENLLVDVSTCRLLAILPEIVSGAPMGMVECEIAGNLPETVRDLKSES